MDGSHDLLPDLRRGVAVEGHVFGSIVSRPDRAGVIRSVSAEPAVLVCGGGTGLAGDGHVAKARFMAGAVGCGVVEHIGHGARGLLREGLNGLRLIIEDYLAAAILDHGVGARIGENAVVCKGGVRLRHFAHSHCRIVRVGIDEARYAEAIAQEIERCRGSELIHDLRRNGVLGFLKRR